MCDLTKQYTNEECFYVQITLEFLPGSGLSTATLLAVFIRSARFCAAQTAAAKLYAGARI